MHPLNRFQQVVEKSDLNVDQIQLCVDVYIATLGKEAFSTDLLSLVNSWNSDLLSYVAQEATWYNYFETAEEIIGFAQVWVDQSKQKVDWLITEVKATEVLDIYGACLVVEADQLDDDCIDFSNISADSFYAYVQKAGKLYSETPDLVIWQAVKKLEQ